MEMQNANCVVRSSAKVEHQVTGTAPYELLLNHINSCKITSNETSVGFNGIYSVRLAAS